MERYATLLREKWGALSPFTQRAITAGILGLLLVLLIGIGGLGFTIVIVAVTLLAVPEWFNLVQKSPPPRVMILYGGLIGAAIVMSYFGNMKLGIFVLLLTIPATYQLGKFEDFKPNNWTYFGIFYLGIPACCIIWLRKNGYLFSVNHTWAPAMLLFCQVWATDIAAYLVGKKLGGPKLAPSISPKKTWSGLLGGVATSCVVTGLLAGLWTLKWWGVYFLVGFALAIIAQAGDLFESWLKRRAGVKDSGTIVPGHGGILDRIDGLLITAPIFTFLLYALS